MATKYTPPDGVGYWEEEKHGKKAWRVRVGRNYLGKSNKPYTRVFSSKKEVETFCRGLEKKKSGDLTTAEKIGITPIQLAEVKVALERLDGKANLLQAVDAWLKYEAPFLTSPTVQDAIKQLVVAKKSQNLSPRHIRDVGTTILSILKGYEKERVDAITPSLMFELLGAPDTNGKAPSPSMRKKRIRYANILFNFSKGRKWIAENPTSGITAPKIIGTGVLVLTPKQVANLLWQSQVVDKTMTPAIAIKIFSGIRNSELFKLRWENIEGDEITVPAAFSKTGRRRAVSIHKTLKAWLALYPDKASEELVFPHRLTRADRTQAWYKEFPPIAQKAGFAEGTWSQNALRHCFGSYHYALHKNENLTAVEMGNSPQVVRAHYLNVVKAGECKRFWELVPASAEALANTPENQRQGELPPEDWGHLAHEEE